MALDGDLMRNLPAFPAKVDAALAAFTEYGSPRVQNYARTNASWADRTGNARQGLTAQAVHSTLVHSIVLSHSVHYGIWLEVRWGGKYGIIRDTIQVEGIRLMGELRTLMSRVT